MAQNGPGKQSRHHAVFLEGVLRGAPIQSIATAANVSRRTVTRWVTAHAAEIEEARGQLIEGATTELRATLLSAVRRLRAEVENPSSPALGIRAATAVISAHHDLSLLGDFAARLVALERRR